MRGETSFDGYISARGMFNFKRPRRLKKPKEKPKPRVCDRCEFFYGEDYEGCDHKDPKSGYFRSS